MKGKLFQVEQLANGLVRFDADDDCWTKPGRLVIFPRCTVPRKYLDRQDLPNGSETARAEFEAERNAALGTGHCACGGTLTTIGVPGISGNVWYARAVACTRAEAQRGLPDPSPTSCVGGWPHEVVPAA